MEREDEVRHELRLIPKYPWVAEGLGSEGYTIKVDIHGNLKEVWNTLGFRGSIGEVRGARDWGQLTLTAHFIAKAPERIDYLLRENHRLQEEMRRIEWISGSTGRFEESLTVVNEIARETLGLEKVTK